jgi:hypothetical protein
MRLPINLLAFALAASATATPVDFGMAELNAAITARNFKYKPKIMAELDIQAPETFRIEPYAAGGAHITGGDLRGLIYGLLEAADQMRTTGKLKMTHGVPALGLRALRITADPDAPWFAAAPPGDDFWQRYFAAMARDRFNRLEIAFDAGPSLMALPTLRSIAQVAAQYGVDLAIGLGSPDSAAVQHLLVSCPSVRAIVLHHPEAVPDVPALLRVLHEVGRRVVLELPNHPDTAVFIETAGQQGTPLRVFSPFTGTAVNPQPRDVYWVLDFAQGSEAATSISGAGFVIDCPANEQRQPDLASLAEWGRSGYTRPLR